MYIHAYACTHVQMCVCAPAETENPVGGLDSVLERRKPVHWKRENQRNYPEYNTERQVVGEHENEVKRYKQ